jgi:hypothetical protein
MQSVDLGRSGSWVDLAPADVQPLGQLSAESGVVEAVGGHGVGVEQLGVKSRPASVGAEGGVLDQDVGVPLRVALAAGAVVEGGTREPQALMALGAVVAAADPDRLAFQVGEDLADRRVPCGLHLPAHVRAAAGGEQADRLHVGERQIERGDPGIDPLPGMLCRLLIGVAVQVANIPAQHRPAESCCGCRVHLPRLGERLKLPPEALVAVGEVGELHSARGRQAPQRRHQRSGIELRARVSAPDCRHTLFSGGGVLPGEEPMYGLISGDRAEASILG